LKYLLVSKTFLLGALLSVTLLYDNTSIAAELQIGVPAPAFSLDSLSDAGKISLADHVGEVVYVDFWASWCGPCRKSLPQLNTLYKDIGDQGFTVIAINVDEYVEDAMDFLNRYPVDYKLARDPDGAIAKLYKLRGMPTSYLIAKDGRLAHIHQGFRDGDMDTIKPQVLELLGE
jgi:thiol-disulfide isomerase/thioredoxin